MKIKVIITLILMLLLSGLSGIPALAADPPNPDNMQVESAKVFRHLVETDDFLLVFHYNIHYDTGQPDTPANKLFIFRLLDTNGVDYLASIVPYAFYNAGYDQGCSAFYFSSTEAPTWEGAYILRISGNPEYFADPPITNYSLVTSDYSQMLTKEENQVVLGISIIDIATNLETNWNTPLLTEGQLGTVLNSAGEAYFRGTITGLQLMAPQIFSVQLTNPVYEETEWAEEQATTYMDRFKDTWVGETLTSFGDQLHMDWRIITGIGTVMIIIALAVFSQLRYATTKPALLGGACVLVGGTVLGFISVAVMSITTLASAIFIGYNLFFRHG